MKKQIILVLDNIRSLYNVGAIFRTADAAGIDQIFLCGITAFPPKKLRRQIDQIDPDNPPAGYVPSTECFEAFLEQSIRKTALASLGQIKWQYFSDTKSALQYLKTKKNAIYALEQGEASVDYRKFTFRYPCAIVLGTEVTGIEPEVLRLCDAILELPMRGKGKSLNVSVATGIILYKMTEA